MPVASPRTQGESDLWDLRVFGAARTVFLPIGDIDRFLQADEVELERPRPRVLVEDNDLERPWDSGEIDLALPRVSAITRAAEGEIDLVRPVGEIDLSLSVASAGERDLPLRNGKASFLVDSRPRDVLSLERPLLVEAVPGGGLGPRGASFSRVRISGSEADVSDDSDEDLLRS